MFLEGNYTPLLLKSKKTLLHIGLAYENIHACKYDRVLFWKENKNVSICLICGESRYKCIDNKRKIPQNVLRYFSLVPRLQRLYVSTHVIRNEMT